MSATDELRRMLDERGVEYEAYIEPLTGFEHVKWNFKEHGSADFNLEFGEPWLTMYGTISGPEQAIEATLGRGTCEVVYERLGYRCKACGARFFLDDDSGEPNFYDECGRATFPNYCPNCGRRVVAGESS